MKIGTSLFLILFLILGGFGTFGYLVKENQDLSLQLEQCNMTVSTETANSQVLQRQIDQYVIVLVQKEKEVLQAQKDAQDDGIKLMQTTQELQTVKDQLVQAKALLTRLSSTTASQPSSIQNPVESAFTPDELSLLGIILGGIIIFTISILGFKKFSLTRQPIRISQEVKQTRRGQIVMTMSDQTYREFQAYLKNRR